MSRREPDDDVLAPGSAVERALPRFEVLARTGGQRATDRVQVFRRPRAVPSGGALFMLPAMNIDDRAKLLGRIRATAPAAAFDGVWGLAASVLDLADHTTLGRRLGLR